MYKETLADLRTVSDEAIAEDIAFRQKTIYGHDRRHDYYEIENPQIREIAGSVAGIFEPVRALETGPRLRLLGKTLGAELNLCSDQAFRAQPVGPFCTAFVVGPDLVATAGHCIDPASGWKSFRVAFGFRTSRTPAGEVAIPQELPLTEVYTPVEIVAQQLPGRQNGNRKGVDYAVLRMDRPITNHAALALHLDGSVATAQGVYVLGHPSGLPLKFAGDAAVRQVVAGAYFLANLDTFGGNSGSPVLNANTHLVEGILDQGDTDYQIVGGCNRAFVCPENGCSGEQATLISTLATPLGGAPKAAAVSAPPPRQPITRIFSSGPPVSGSGSSFSGEYVVASDPAPEGYKIGDYSYSLTGDRACNAWSTCRASAEGGRVLFRFTLQGHNEWPPPGQAISTGNLIVTYAPK